MLSADNEIIINPLCPRRLFRDVHVSMQRLHVSLEEPIR